MFGLFIVLERTWVFHEGDLMELLQLRYFCTVAQMESITNAAKFLNISQPSLSKTIINLEREIGAPLFDRLSRRIYLNAKGKQFYEKVRDGLELIDNAQNQLNNTSMKPSGEIKIFVLAASSLIPDMIAGFVINLPQIKINLYQQICHDLHFSDEYDFSISATPMDYSHLDVYPLLSEEIVLAVPIDHPLSTQDEIKLSEAADYNFIAFSKGPSIRVLSDSLCYMAGFAPKIVFESDGINTLFTMIEAGLGISLLPAETHRKIDTNKIKLLRISEPFASRTVNLAWRSEKYMTSACMLFKQHCIDFFYEHSKNI
ncbi:MAG TPA: LysR family transcriptional regulator [Epulopiscium sp.]|nr:LysR family transcriptional regulator [Candidatus Epulonipiscium sp.]